MTDRKQTLDALVLEAVRNGASTRHELVFRLNQDPLHAWLFKAIYTSRLYNLEAADEIGKSLQRLRVSGAIRRGEKGWVAA